MLREGSQVGRYKLVRELGRGGMGCVFEAVHVELGKPVALKTLHPHLVGADLRDRFLREGRAAAKLRHPNVVEVFDAGEDDGVMYLVMELLEGEDLGHLLARECRLEPGRAVDLLLPVLAAVATVHQQTIVHRDLKPQNIFLARDPYGELHPKVLDFGISKLRADSNLTPVGGVLGSPHYMSPEQAVGLGKLDPRSDQFSLGVILYEVLTGALPFDGPDLVSVMEAIRSAQVVPPRELVPSLPAGLESVVLRALEKRREDRYETVFALGHELAAFAGERGRVLWAPVFARGGARVPMPPPPSAGAGREETTRPPQRGRADDRTPLTVARGEATQPVSEQALGMEQTRLVGGVQFLPASDENALGLARAIVAGSQRPVLVCAAAGPSPESRPPLSQILAAAKELSVVVFVDGIGRVTWKSPMEELAQELAPDKPVGSYLFFERGQCVHAVKKDLWNPAADAQRIREYLTARRRRRSD